MVAFTFGAELAESLWLASSLRERKGGGEENEAKEEKETKQGEYEQ